MNIPPETVLKIFNTGFGIGYIVATMVMVLGGFIVEAIENSRLQRFLTEKKMHNDFEKWKLEQKKKRFLARL